MLGEVKLRAVLPSLRLISIHGLWVRAVPSHYLHGPPLGAPIGGKPEPLWPHSAARDGARFTPRGGFGTIYLASNEETASAEVRDQYTDHDQRYQPLTIVTVDGILAGVLDLTDRGVQVALGTSLSELTGHWRPMQDLGETPPTQLLAQIAYEAGTIVALRYVSAKRPAGTGIAVFSDRLVIGHPNWLQVIDPHGHYSQRLP